MRYAKAAWLWPLLLTLCSCSLAPPPEAGQGERQYSWVDADGHMHMSAIPTIKPAAPVPAVAPLAAGATPASGGAASGLAATPVLSGPKELFAPDEAFVDSETLERKHFNLDDKKKFGQVPDVTGQLRIVYFDSGEGQSVTTAASGPALPELFPVVPTLPDEAAWPLRRVPGDCCAALLSRDKEHAQLELNHSYSARLPAAACLARSDCQPQLLGLKGKHLAERKRDVILRLRSFMSSASCKRCVQWPTLVVLDDKGRARRAYQAPLGGYRKETWNGYASFGYDLTLHPDDAWLLLVGKEAVGKEKDTALYAGKTYTVVEKGEIAFTLIQ